MIEVIMCTYNGIKFVEKQLDSIRYQTKQADRVSIFDDISDDGTTELIKNYIENYNLSDKWILHVNEKNKGWRRNFFDGILESQGDIIFFSDQDDIWELDKIEVMAKVFEDNTDVIKLNSYFSLIDENDLPFEYKKWNCFSDNTKTIQKERFEDNFGINWKHRIGCATAIRGEVRQLLQEISFNYVFSHDMVLENIFSGINKSYFIDYKSIKYRIHENNMNKKIKTDFQYEIDLGKYVYSGLSQFGNEVNKSYITLVNRYIKFNQLRKKVNSKFAIFSWLMLIGYMDFYCGNKFRNLIGDLINTMHLRNFYNKIKKQIKK